MSRNWTFGQKVGAGFAVIVALAALISAVSAYSLKSAVAAKDRVLAVNAQNLIDAARLEAGIEWTVAAFRGFLLAREDRFLEHMSRARAEVAESLRELRRHAGTDTEESRGMLEEIERLETEHGVALERVVALRKTDADLPSVIRLFEEEALPRRDALHRQMGSFVSRETRLLESAKRASTEAASSAVLLVIAIAIAAVLGAIAVALLLTRTLGRQVGAAVQHIQSSSAELQAAANQQATGAREQASAVSEITTTISELLVTSRQIAESAQRVAQIAQETASSARGGDLTAQKAHESLGSIKKQVDLIVTHMLDLGKKSQQIGGILEIINELAEQTNILAINATIEAAGAGESGKRFAVVADEIRKLADRVGGSTKEIRVLVDEIRAAVNTTVMATEGGTKAVDAGTRQFAEVTTSLTQITGLVGVTTEAAREIELSTKQQSTAVEQVNLAISNVGQATRETEASSSQTLLTATQLTGLSRDLSRLVQPNAG